LTPYKKKQVKKCHFEPFKDMEWRKKGLKRKEPRNEQDKSVSVYTNYQNSINLSYTSGTIFCLLLTHFLLSLVSSSYCDSVADLRRKIQKIGKNRLLFLDETAMRLNEAPTRTLVYPGESEYVLWTTKCFQGLIDEIYLS
jgi:hypothetical protein